MAAPIPTNLFTNMVDFRLLAALRHGPPLESKNPEAEPTIANIDGCVSSLEEMKPSVSGAGAGVDREQDRRSYQGVPRDPEDDPEEHHQTRTQGVFHTRDLTLVARADNVASLSTMIASTTPSANSETRRRRR